MTMGHRQKGADREEHPGQRFQGWISEERQLEISSDSQRRRLKRALFLGHSKMMRSLLPRMVIATFICLLLLSALPAPDVSASEAPDQPEIRYRLIAAEDLPTLKAAVGVQEPGRDYNVIIGGFGTGLAPPSEREWELSVGTMFLDLGSDDYEVPTASSLDLSSEPYFPEVRSQGSEGSCAAFSLTYYNYGYIEAKDNAWSGAKTGNTSQLLSPSWTYNKINGGEHEASSFQENARIIKQLGAATWASYPYVASDDEGLGPEAAWRTAPLHRISAYTSVYSPSPSTVVSLIKEQLGLGRPVSFAIDANQYSTAFADSNYIMSAQEYSHTAFNHGQTVVGYDDSVTDDGDVGAFKVVNSWGKSWGQSGYYYITYEALKEMLGAPLIYLTDIADYQPTMLATWTFSQSPSVEATLEVGAGSSTSPIDKVSTYFSTGSSNRMCAFMAIDASSLKNEYDGGTGSYYLKVGSASASGVASSFQLELFQDGYLPTPGAVVARSSEVPKAVPGTVNAGLVQTDVIPPVSSVVALPEYTNSSLFQVRCSASDAGGSGLVHWELFYRFNSLGSFLRYAPSGNPTGTWTSEELSFDASQASGQGYYQFYSLAVDGDGNREQAPGVPDARTTVDLNAPSSTAVPAGTAGQNGWYISAVTLSFSADDALSGVQRTAYRLNGGSWSDYSSPLVLGQGDHLLEYRSVDRAGNWEGVKNLELKVDTSAPSVISQANLTAVNGWYRSTVGVTLSVSDTMDTSCPLQFRLDGGGWVAYSGTIAVSGDGQHLLDFEARDDAGNLGQGSLTVRIDTASPVSQATVEGVAGGEGRYLGPVTVTISGNDQGSGISGMYYRLNGGTWYAYSSHLQLTDDGALVLEHYAVDIAGNTGAVGSLTVIIDSQAPVITLLTDGVPQNGWYRSMVNVSLTAMDAFDGERPVQCSLDGGPWTPTAGTVLVSGEGHHTLAYRTSDLAGNQASGTLSLDIDTAAPASEHQVSGEMGQDGRFTSAVDIILSATDAGSGVQGIRYRLDGAAWTAYSSVVRLTEDGVHLLEHFAVDKAGNEGPIIQLEVLIDSHGPSVSIDTDRQPSSYDWYDGPVTIALVSSDHFDQGCPVYFRWDGGEWSVYADPLEMSSEEVRLLECYAVDLAGNQGSVVERTFRLDLSAPACSAEVSGELGLNGIYVSEVQAVLTASDQGSGVAAAYFRLNGGPWNLVDGTVTLMDQGITLLEFYALDKAGNAGPIGSASLTIDTIAPSVLAETDVPAREGWFTSEVFVSLYPDEAGCSVLYRRGSGDWTDYDGPVAVSQHGLTVLEFRAVDLAGNEGPLGRSELKLDLITPQVSATFDGFAGENGFFVSEVNVSSTAEDEGSGVSSVWLRVDGGDWALWNGYLELDSDGHRLLEMYAQDIAGNRGGTVRMEVAIDTHAPRMGLEVLKEAQPDGSYLNHALVGLHAEDAESGVALFRYRVDDGPWLDADESVLVQGEGSHVISCFALDAAGNNASTELSIEIVLPLQAPLAVQDLTAMVSEEGILLTWSPSTTGLEAGYRVYRSVEGQEVLLAEIMTTSYLDENVSEGVEYDYRVETVNNVGYGPSALVQGMALPVEELPLPLLLSIALAGLGLAAAVLFLRRR